MRKSAKSNFVTDIHTYRHTYIQTYIHTDIPWAIYRTIPFGRSKMVVSRPKSSELNL